MTWIKIDRDENGFASIESINAIVNCIKMEPLSRWLLKILTAIHMM